MKECQETHIQCRQEGTHKLPDGFRVVDVVERCIVERNDIPYLALSYAWGENLSPQLLIASKATIAALMKKNGLPKSRMPRTIEDAITACLRIGYRYLWVDRLCIIQDSGEDKRNQIEAMGDIFSSARMVFMATYGDNMDFGIPGVGHPRKTVQKSQDILRLRVTAVIKGSEYNYYDSLNRWCARAWTYQESVLPSRQLYFTDTQVFFQCRLFVCFEDRFSLSRSFQSPNQLTLPGDASRFGSYARHLLHYSRRYLTCRSDAILAIQGVSMALYSEANALIYGMPRRDFDKALLWFSSKWGTRLTKAQGLIQPSWSWSSLIGSVEMITYPLGMSFYGTLASWFLMDNGPLRPYIQSLNIAPNISVDEGWQNYLAAAHRGGCPTSPIDGNSNVREGPSTPQEDYYTFCRRTLSYTMKVRNRTHTKAGVIGAKCQVVFLGLIISTESSCLAPAIIDTRRQVIGTIQGSASELMKQLLSFEYDKCEKYEFIALSLSGKEPNSEDNRKGYGCSARGSLPKLPIVNVMMISRNGKYAQRRELGYIYLVDWVRLRKQWKFVFLE